MHAAVVHGSWLESVDGELRSRPGNVRTAVRADRTLRCCTIVRVENCRHNRRQRDDSNGNGGASIYLQLEPTVQYSLYVEISTRSQTDITVDTDRHPVRQRRNTQQTRWSKSSETDNRYRSRHMSSWLTGRSPLSYLSRPFIHIHHS